MKTTHREEWEFTPAELKLALMAHCGIKAQPNDVELITDLVEEGPQREPVWKLRRLLLRVETSRVLR